MKPKTKKALTYSLIIFVVATVFIILAYRPLSVISYEETSIYVQLLGFMFQMILLIVLIDSISGDR